MAVSLNMRTICLILKINIVSVDRFQNDMSRIKEVLEEKDIK